MTDPTHVGIMGAILEDFPHTSTSPRLSTGHDPKIHEKVPMLDLAY